MSESNKLIKEHLWALHNKMIYHLSSTEKLGNETPQFNNEERTVSQSSLSELALTIAECQNCPLGFTRTKTVVGEGPSKALVMVIGEAPGRDEDLSGNAFVGKAGNYLDSWLSSISLNRTTNTYITNIVKCRPPNNRDPQAEEAQSCLPYLLRQIELIQPSGILCVGKVAANYLLNKEEPLGAMRTKVHLFNTIPVVVTYHPAAVLRNSNLRAAVWEDLQRLAHLLNLPVAQKRSR